MSSRVFEKKGYVKLVMYATQVVWLCIVPQREATNKQSITVCHSPTLITAAATVRFNQAKMQPCRLKT